MLWNDGPFSNERRGKCNFTTAGYAATAYFGTAVLRYRSYGVEHATVEILLRSDRTTVP